MGNCLEWRIIKMEFGYATKADINQLTELRIAYILEDQKTVSDEDMQIMKKSRLLKLSNKYAKL